VGAYFFTESELQQPMTSCFLMQVVACVYAFAAIDAAIIGFEIGRVDAGDACGCAVIALGAIAGACRIVFYVQGISGHENPLPYPVQADVITPEIPDYRDVQKDEYGHYKIQLLHEP
jgi:hypothetical protein